MCSSQVVQRCHRAPFLPVWSLIVSNEEYKIMCMWKKHLYIFQFWWKAKSWLYVCSLQHIFNAFSFFEKQLLCSKLFYQHGMYPATKAWKKQFWTSVNLLICCHLGNHVDGIKRGPGEEKQCDRRASWREDDEVYGGELIKLEEFLKDLCWSSPKK